MGEIFGEEGLVLISRRAIADPGLCLAAYETNLAAVPVEYPRTNAEVLEPVHHGAQHPSWKGGLGHRWQVHLFIEGPDRGVGEAAVLLRPGPCGGLHLEQSLEPLKFFSKSCPGSWLIWLHQ